MNRIIIRQITILANRNNIHEMKLWRIGIGIYSWPKYQRIDLWRIYSRTIHELFANSKCVPWILAFITLAFHQAQPKMYLFCKVEGRVQIIFKASALWADAFYKSKCPSVCPSVRLSVRLSVCLFTFEVPFKRLFAPTSRSRMSNSFRDSEFLGKSNGKKWSNIWTF